MLQQPASVTSPDLATVWTSLGWQPSAGQLALFEQLQVELRSWNSRLNLTRLVEGDDFWIAQIVDSLWPFAELLQQQQSNPTALRLSRPDLAAADQPHGASPGRCLNRWRFSRAGVGHCPAGGPAGPG